MSADFWAGYISGAVGIVVGNPLDLIKVRLQARKTTAHTSATPNVTAALTTGTAAPILGYGALNALLFVSYNRSEAALHEMLPVNRSLTTWLAGAIGGLATWAVSTPTEVIKCRAQAATVPISSSVVARRILQHEGIRGLYFGGTVTALRDSIGYGFYFWSYELATSYWPSPAEDGIDSTLSQTSRVLLCGGLAGIATWASVFPLDVIKTRVQTQPWDATGEARLLLNNDEQRPAQRAGAWQVAKESYRECGPKVFFRGFTICCVRAFIVNAVQWATYEWTIRKFTQGKT